MAVMNNPLVQKLTGVRDLKRILETTVKELGDQFNADACQVTLANPLDPNVTSICEYRAMGVPVVAGRSHTLPLVLQGRTFGAMTISRSYDVTNDELNYLRIILGELGEIIRLAQINDVVQRDTFRDTFLVEIGNLMTYSLGIGDALFMVVNILGKALQVSRCLFICTDDQQAGWKCYEYWQQEKVQSLKQCYWPSADSALVAQTLLAREPLRLFEGQQNSYNSPAQEEMLLIGVKSLLGVALRSQFGVHGCVVLQQCDYRRAWTRNEIDMVQNVSDKVAEALYRLPVEKKAREPIMQLHQRIVETPAAEEHRSSLDVRRALKGAMGQQAIPQALKSGQVPPPPAPKPVPPAPPTPAVPAAGPAAVVSPTPTPASVPAATAAPTAPVAAAAEVAPAAVTPAPAAEVAPAAVTPAPAAEVAPAPVTPAPAAEVAPAPVTPSPAAEVATAPVTPAPAAEAAISTEAKIKAQSITGEFPRGDAGPSVASVPKGITLGDGAPIAIEHDPYADLDFGDFSELGSLPDIAIPTPPAPPVQESPWIGPDTSAAPPAPPPPEPTISPIKPTVPAAPQEVVESFAPEPAVEVVMAEPAVSPTPSAAPAAEASPISAPTSAPAPAAAAPQAAVTEPAVKPEALDLSALDAIPTPKAAAPAALDLSALDAIPTPKAAAPAALDLSALDAIPTPKAPAGEGADWGDLDAIGAPAAAAPSSSSSPAPRGGGLGGSLMGKARGSASAGPLKSKLGRSAPPPEPMPEAAPSPVEAAPKSDEPFDAVAAQKKLDALVSTQGDGTSDYIFATPGLDMRMLGRIDGWVSQIEAKDKYKCGHAKAVAEYAQAIAKEMGLPQADIDIIRQASLVHDLGKLGTAAPILQKSDKDLTDAEFLMIMNHTIDGAELLDSFPDLKHLAPIVRAHHEEYDGNGYPLGLKGEQIPLAARVVGLANYYHERVADQTARSGDNPGKVQMEIVEAAGKQFDPNACQGLIQAIITGRVAEKL